MILRCALTVCLCILAGCSELPKRDTAKSGPFYTPTNVTSLGKLPLELRRVLVLPVASSEALSEDTLARISDVVSTELTRTARFEVTVLKPDELRQVSGLRSALSTAALPPDFFEKLAARYGVEGILFTDITTYSPYPPLTVGLRFKLARVVDRQIIWAADNVFAASDPAVANSARRHSLKLGADRGPGDLSHTILQNPSRFTAFAAAESFATLPSR